MWVCPNICPLDARQFNWVEVTNDEENEMPHCPTCGDEMSWEPNVFVPEELTFTPNDDEPHDPELDLIL